MSNVEVTETKKKPRKKTTKKTPLTFEEAYAELERIVHELEAGNVNLDSAVERFNEGVALVALCEQKLNDAEKNVVKVITEEGEITPFQMEENNVSTD